MLIIEEVYGAEIRTIVPDDDSLIVNSSLPQKEQKWVKAELPSFFDKVEYSKKGDLILTPAQEQYALSELKKCKEGISIYINGKLKFIPPKYYFYLQYYILEDGIAPDFREADRKWFLFLWHWQKIEWASGSIRTKKRRAGASSQACSNLIYEAIFFKNTNCGLISKTQQDSKDTFTEMVTASYRQLPVFLKPKQVNREDSVSELVFAYKSENQKEGVASAIKTDEGHRSKITYRAPVLNAFDRSRQNLILIDEGAKFPRETPTSQLVSIIQKTLMQGVKRVGWLELCSTVNEMTKGGGAEYKKIWTSANQFVKKPTTNRLVRFFQPAFEAFAGFIDEYGESVIHEPTEEQFNYLVSKWVKRDEDTGEVISELSEDDIRKGSYHYVKVKRREGLEGIALEEEIRQNPCDEDEAFLSAVSDCHFNSLNIKKKQKAIEQSPPSLRKVSFFRALDQTVSWRDDEDGFWNILAFPPSEKQNKSTIQDKLKKPSNILDYVMGVDGFSASQGGRKYGSNAAGFVMNRNTMQYIAMYFGRPRTKELYHEQILLASEFYGCKVWIEKTADSYFEYFKDRGRLGYLGKYPFSCIDPDKKESAERYYGFPINPFAMTRQMDTMMGYIDNDPVTGETYCSSIEFSILLEQLLIFEAEKRTDYDAVVAAMITLCCALEPVHKTPKPLKPLIKVY